MLVGSDIGVDVDVGIGVGYDCFDYYSYCY